MLVSVTYAYGTNILATLKATEFFVLMHSGIVNEYRLLCEAHIVLEPHIRTFYSLSFFSTFSFMCLSLLTVLFLFLGASIVCVNNL